jgi:hypothetical protein
MGTLISYSFRGDARPGSTLRAVCLEADPRHPKSSSKCKPRLGGADLLWLSRSATSRRTLPR